MEIIYCVVSVLQTQVQHIKFAIHQFAIHQFCVVSFNIRHNLPTAKL